MNRQKRIFVVMCTSCSTAVTDIKVDVMAIKVKINPLCWLATWLPWQRASNVITGYCIKSCWNVTLVRFFKQNVFGSPKPFQSNFRHQQYRFYSKKGSSKIVQSNERVLSVVVLRSHILKIFTPSIFSSPFRPPAFLGAEACHKTVSGGLRSLES